MLELQWEELKYWKRGIPISLSFFRNHRWQPQAEKMTFYCFGRNWVEQSSRKENTKKLIDNSEPAKSLPAFY